LSCFNTVYDDDRIPLDRSQARLGIGQIQPDGSFTPSTLVASTKVTGAVSGRHQIIVMPSPPDTGDIQAIAQPVIVPPPWEVKPEGANLFTVRLPQRR